MAYPFDAPLVAGGSDPFAGIAAQRQYYVGLNQRQSEENLARAAAAQQARNNWLQTVAQLQRSDFAGEERAQQRAEELALSRSDTARQEAERTREFDVGTELTKAQQAITREQYEAQRTEKKRVEQQSLDAMKNVGEAKAQDVADLGDLHDNALEIKNKAEEELRQRGEELASKVAPGKVGFSASTGTIGPVRGAFLLPDENKKIAEANQELAPLKSAYDAANNNFVAHSKNWAQLHSDLMRFHLVPTKDEEGWAVMNSVSGDKYRGKKKVAPQTKAASENWLETLQNNLRHRLGGEVSPAAEPVAAGPPPGITPLPEVGERFPLNATPQPAPVNMESEGGPGFWSNLGTAALATPRALGYLGGKFMQNKPEDRVPTWAGFAQAIAPERATTNAARPGKTHVMSPDGRTGWIPNEQLPVATTQGYVVIE
jgi:hypothetical protein